MPLRVGIGYRLEELMGERDDLGIGGQVTVWRAPRSEERAVGGLVEGETVGEDGGDQGAAASWSVFYRSEVIATGLDADEGGGAAAAGYRTEMHVAGQEEKEDFVGAGCPAGR